MGATLPVISNEIAIERPKRRSTVVSSGGSQASARLSMLQLLHGRTPWHSERSGQDHVCPTMPISGPVPDHAASNFGQLPQFSLGPRM
jgi:hypothetical protein